MCNKPFREASEPPPGHPWQVHVDAASIWDMNPASVDYSATVIDVDDNSIVHSLWRTTRDFAAAAILTRLPTDISVDLWLAEQAAQHTFAIVAVQTGPARLRCLHAAYRHTFYGAPYFRPHELPRHTFVTVTAIDDPGAPAVPVHIWPAVLAGWPGSAIEQYSVDRSTTPRTSTMTVDEVPTRQWEELTEVLLCSPKGQTHLRISGVATAPRCN